MKPALVRSSRIGMGLIAAFLLVAFASLPLMPQQGANPATSGAPSIKVTLLGTGAGPPVNLDRFGAGTRPQPLNGPTNVGHGFFQSRAEPREFGARHV